MNGLTRAYYGAARKLPQRLGRGLLGNWAIVQIMSVTLAKTRDPQLRRWIHEEHHRYFNGFSDPQTVAEAFDASLSTDVTRYAGALTMPVLVIAGADDEIAPAPGQHTFVDAAAERGTGDARRCRPPHPLRTAGPRRGGPAPLPGNARVKIVVDCRYTRLEHHDGISRYARPHRRGARPPGAAGRARGHHADQRREAARRCCPTCRGRRSRADQRTRAVGGPPGQQAEAGCRVHPHADDGRGGPPVRARQDAARPDLLPQSHASARSQPRDPAALAPVPPGLVAAAACCSTRPTRSRRSRQTSKGLIEEHRLTKRPLTIVRNAADPRPGPPVHRDQPVTRELLYMGSFMPYKNVETLALALHVLPGLPPAPAVEDRAGRPPPAARARASRRADGAQRRHATPSTPSCSTTRSRSCTRRSTRGSASRSSRRWRPGRRSWSATSRSSARWGRMRPATSRRRIRMRRRPRSARSRTARSGRARRRAGARSPPAYDWDASAGVLLEVLRAGRRYEIGRISAFVSRASSAGSIANTAVALPAAAHTTGSSSSVSSKTVRRGVRCPRGGTAPIE